MNRRTLLTVVLVLVLSGVAALAGGRRLGEVVRPQDPVLLETPADGAPVVPPEIAVPVAVAD